MFTVPPTRQNRLLALEQELLGLQQREQLTSQEMEWPEESPMESVESYDSAELINFAEDSWSNSWAEDETQPGLTATRFQERPVDEGNSELAPTPEDLDSADPSLSLSLASQYEEFSYDRLTAMLMQPTRAVRHQPIPKPMHLYGEEPDELDLSAIAPDFNPNVTPASFSPLTSQNRIPHQPTPTRQKTVPSVPDFDVLAQELSEVGLPDSSPGHSQKIDPASAHPPSSEEMPSYIALSQMLQEARSTNAAPVNDIEESNLSWRTQTIDVEASAIAQPESRVFMPQSAILAPAPPDRLKDQTA